MKINEGSHKCTICNPFLVNYHSSGVRQGTHSKGPFVCSECYKRFPNRIYLVRHLKKHQNNHYLSCSTRVKTFSSSSNCKKNKILYREQKYYPEYECALCSDKFTTKYKLRIHIKSHNPEIYNKFTCTLCGCSFQRKMNFTVHMYKHFGRPDIHCAFCDDVFKSYANLEKHKRDHSTGPFTCFHCLKVYKRRHRFERHLENAHTNVQLFEGISGKESFQTERILKNHLNLHNKLVECAECGKRFGSEGTLKRHMVVHNEARPFSCHICEASFKTKSAIRKHVLLHKKSENKIISFVCFYCKKSFMHKSILTNHILSNHLSLGGQCNRYLPHKQNISFKHLLTPRTCDHCNQTFISEHVWKKHIKLHAPANTCIYCNRSLKTRAAFVAHVHSHNGKEFTCTTCDESFQSKQEQIVHERVHNLQCYSCRWCNATFSLYGLYLRHIDKHAESEDKCGKYLCLECGKIFTCSAELRRHERMHSLYVEKGPYMCALCDQTLKTKSVLLSHMKTHKKPRSNKYSTCDDTFQHRPDVKKQKHTCAQSSNDQLLNGCVASPEGTCLQISICPICGRKVKNRGALITHTKRHRRVIVQKQIFLCAQCYHPMKTKSALISHIKSHDKGISHRCN